MINMCNSHTVYAQIFFNEWKWQMKINTEKTANAIIQYMEQRKKRFVAEDIEFSSK